MATTDAKPGFRLPWSSDRSETANPADAAPEAATGEASHPQQEIETPEMIDAAPAATDHEADTSVASDPTSTPAAQPTPAAAPAPAAAALPPARKQNKFMADLTKAMQVAAESAREETLARFNAEAKTYIEGIHATSSGEATDLRKKADDDVAAIREWSKAEIARIREETDERISHRKTTLEHEVDEHAAFIESRIERVQARVNAFETEMAAFFERLLAEEDPTRFAAMAESLPEPPPFDGPAPERDEAWYTAPLVEAAAVEAPVVEAEVTGEAVVTSEAVAEVAPDAVADAPMIGEADAVAAFDAPVADVATEAPAVDPAWGEPEAVATEVTAEAVEAVAAPEAPEAVVAETEAPADAGDLFSIAADDAPEGDPRLSMLGLTPDFAAAEAEAAAFSTDDTGDEEIPELPDEAIAARIAGLVPETEVTGPVVTTRVIVTGLISVASIAGFKRHLSRAAGVQSVGVSSGPDGEFVFAVGHSADVALRDVVPTLPGFSARVTAESDGEITVAARDPEAEG